jgi:hypothetical protein
MTPVSKLLVTVSMTILSACGYPADSGPAQFTQCVLPLTMKTPVTKTLHRDVSRGCFGLYWAVPASYPVTERVRSSMGETFTIRVPQSELPALLVVRRQGLIEVGVKPLLMGTWINRAQPIVQSRFKVPTSLKPER